MSSWNSLIIKATFNAILRIVFFIRRWQKWIYDSVKKATKIKIHDGILLMWRNRYSNSAREIYFWHLHPQSKTNPLDVYMIENLIPEYTFILLETKYEVVHIHGILLDSNYWEPWHCMDLTSSSNRDDLHDWLHIRLSGCRRFRSSWPWVLNKTGITIWFGTEYGNVQLIFKSKCGTELRYDIFFEVRHGAILVRKTGVIPYRTIPQAY